MKTIKLVLILILLITFCASCKKTTVNQKDFEWSIDLNKTYKDDIILNLTPENSIVISGTKANLEVDFEGQVISTESKFKPNKSEQYIYFYAKTIGNPLFGIGRRSKVEMIDSSLFDHVYFIDKVVVKAKIDRNDDEKYYRIQFFSKKNNKKYILTFNKYDNISNVYDIIQIDKSRFAVTYEVYEKTLPDYIYSLSILNFSDLID